MRPAIGLFLLSILLLLNFTRAEWIWNTIDDEFAIESARTALSRIKLMLHEQFGDGYSVSSTDSQVWVTYPDDSSVVYKDCDLGIVCATPVNTTIPEFTLGSRTIVPNYHADLNPTWYETAKVLALRECTTVLDFIVHMDTVWSGVTTLFQRVGDDFVRIASTVPVDYGGELLAVGSVMKYNTSTGAVNDRVKTLLDGKEWNGPISLFSKTYYSSYQPIFVDGQVVGALYFGSTAVIKGVCALWVVFGVLLLFACGLCVITQCVCCNAPPFASGGRSMTLYILAGCILCLISAFVGVSWPGLPAARCWAETWLFYLGESMALAALTAKTFRVWRIFQKAKQFKQSTINTLWLHVFIIGVLGLQALFMLAYTIIAFWPAPATLWVSPVRPIACDTFLDNIITFPAKAVVALLVLASGLLAIKTRTTKAPHLEAVKEAGDLAYVLSALVVSMVFLWCAGYFSHGNLLYSLARFIEPAMPAVIIAGGLFVPKTWRAAELFAQQRLGWRRPAPPPETVLSDPLGVESDSETCTANPMRGLREDI
ncbi:7 transmembrane sweet-taste receptor of 3 GCPR [Carpediemonas membranifera]|uniref:7 transmembrane sweet-taste receptor of 3 GCPR n=1 Tax=Carpediemonas membranifera TaxID=201153 RepID=A0A8J6AVV1_9EUKA|nr:7 transmembrane sweet-taste receptor of 3 GCPR [Carpediemonas membranifera]|eukprot:KAG9392850.1 7 transmembrane sweet-taste receptor of 3 GCPR [Carpediemonas membranifera]